jgi:broad specificity phosphatase PhoE
MEIYFVRHGQSTENEASDKGIAYDKDNIILTKLGQEQAKKTGKYLEEMEKFDMVFCSPIKRCVETAQKIIENMNYKGEIIKSNLLVEIGEFNNPTAGLSKEEKKDFFQKNKNIMDLHKKISSEKNLFKVVELEEKLNDKYAKYTKSEPDLETSIKNIKKFLAFIKKQNFKRILVVTHGALINVIMKIITNINPNNYNIYFTLPNQNTKKYIENCCIMGILLKNKKFELVIPPNTQHLQQIN